MVQLCNWRESDVRILTHIPGAFLPLAELLLVLGLFWGVICGNVMTDVIGTVIFRRSTLAQGWEIMERGYDVPDYRSDPDANLSIFYSPTDIAEKNDAPTDQKAVVAPSIRLLEDLCGGRLSGLKNGAAVAGSSL